MYIQRTPKPDHEAGIDDLANNIIFSLPSYRSAFKILALSASTLWWMGDIGLRGPLILRQVSAPKEDGGRGAHALRRLLRIWRALFSLWLGLIL